MSYRDIKFKKPSKHDNYFPTQEIRAKGFSRELKSLVLNKDIKECLEKPEHEVVLDALNKAINNSPLIPDEFKKKIINKDFVSTSRLSDWWNGRGFPTIKNKEIIDIIYPNLTSKWFSREKFFHRLQLHLATFDIKYIDSKNSQHAVMEAIDILEKIGEDWIPKENHHDSGYLIISGPKKRAGLNFKKYKLNESINSSSARQELGFQEYLEKKNIKYDLSIDTPSFVEINLSKELSDIYQTTDPLTIIPYLFCLLCLGEDDGSNYKQDLFIDFLSALNCAFFLLNKKYGGVYDLKSDKYFGYILALFLQVNDFYYKDYWSQQNIKKRRIKREVSTEKIKLEYETNNVEYTPIIDLSFMDNPLIYFIQILEDIVNTEVILTTDSNGIFSPDYYYSHIPKLLKKFRTYYFSLYQTCGYDEEKITNKLLQSFTNYSSEDGSNIRHFSSKRTVYRLPYK